MKRYLKASSVEYTEDNLNNIRQELNSKLRDLRTWSDLEDFKIEMDSYGFGFNFRMLTKKGGWENGMWKHDDTSVDYITDRTNSVYRCQIKNLYRVMEVY